MVVAESDDEIVWRIATDDTLITYNALHSTPFLDFMSIRTLITSLIISSQNL